jgi:hypothetical protein
VDGPYIVYGSPGSGSVPVEAALSLIGTSYEVIGESVLRDVARNPAVFTVNPLGQVPVLVLPGGGVMTESAAILIWLADCHPDAGLAPLATDERRPAFLRGWPTSPRRSTDSPGCEEIRCGSCRMCAKWGWCWTASLIVAPTAGAGWMSRFSQVVFSSAIIWAYSFPMPTKLLGPGRADLHLGRGAPPRPDALMQTGGILEWKPLANGVRHTL